VISDITKSGNFKVKNNNNDELKESYPRWQLKQVKESIQHYITMNDIKSIQSYKKKGNKTFYLINLKDNTKKWILKTKIDPNLIQDYHKKLERKNSIFKKFNFSKFLTILMILFSLCDLGYSQSIKDDFRLCSTSNLKTIINPNSYCRQKEQKELHNNKYVINDFGYQCSKTRRVKELNQTWSFSLSGYVFSKNVDLSRIESLAMVESKLCFLQKMQF